MICQSCCDAGDLYSKIKGAPRPSNVAEATDAMISGASVTRIKELHDQCPGGTWCDCQHMPTIEILEMTRA